MTDNTILKALECCPQDNPNHNCARCAYKPIEGYCFEYLMKDALDLINRLEADKEALIAGQETLQKALAEKNAEIENQSQNLKVLVSDHRTLQQSFDNLKGLYEDEKSKVEKAKEKSIYFAKELQAAKAEIERLQNEIVIRDKIIDERGNEVIRHDRCIRTLHEQIKTAKSEAIKEFAERLRRKFPIEPMGYSGIGSMYSADGIRSKIDNLVKEMVGEG